MSTWNLTEDFRHLNLSCDKMFVAFLPSFREFLNAAFFELFHLRTLYTTLKCFCLCGSYLKLETKNTYLLKNTLHVKIILWKKIVFQNKNRNNSIILEFCCSLCRAQLDSSTFNLLCYIVWIEVFGERKISGIAWCPGLGTKEGSCPVPQCTLELKKSLVV